MSFPQGCFGTPHEGGPSSQRTQELQLQTAEAGHRDVLAAEAEYAPST